MKTKAIKPGDSQCVTVRDMVKALQGMPPGAILEMDGFYITQAEFSYHHGEVSMGLSGTPPERIL